MPKFAGMVCSVLVLVLLCMGIVSALSDSARAVEPGVYLNFNEGGSSYANDNSGHGNAGAIHGATRIENGGCGRALLFDGNGSYIAIPYSSHNHPTQEITVSLWFYTDTFAPQVLLSSYNNGGYRLGFDDANDLWWTVRLDGIGDVSLPIQHEGITAEQWHHVTGTYDGETSRIYLDGVLRNQVNRTGTIRYEYRNYVIVGAEAGTSDSPDPDCPRYFRGGIDEVRIYDQALSYGQVMDDRFSCPTEPGVHQIKLPVQPVIGTCNTPSGSVDLTTGGTVTRELSFQSQMENGTWHVSLPAGARLIVRATDRYATSNPDAWYVELSDENGRITRSIAFPNTNNAPTEGVVPSGNATVLVRYFDGTARFPSQMSLQFDSVAPTVTAQSFIPANILVNPIIVIYSASWATVIAVVIVILWLHKRRKQKTPPHKEK
ncbi:MAG: LamG domain-containing protein [Methanoregula sp.]|nr:LamG domain-containing protein [Methanoregula sp.]